MARPYAQRPSTLRAQVAGLPYGIKVNTLGQAVVDPNIGWGDQALPDGSMTYAQLAEQYNNPPPQDFGGGGGGGYQRPFYDPNTDPAFQALLSSLGLAETTARTAAAGRTADVDAQLALSLPQIGEQGIEQRRGIDQNFEDRGFYRSGERLRGIGIQQRGEAQRVASTNLAGAQQKSEIQRGLDASIADLAQRRAQAQLDAGLRTAGY